MSWQLQVIDEWLGRCTENSAPSSIARLRQELLAQGWSHQDVKHLLSREPGRPRDIVHELNIVRRSYELRSILKCAVEHDIDPREVSRFRKRFLDGLREQAELLLELETLRRDLLQRAKGLLERTTNQEDRNKLTDIISFVSSLRPLDGAFTSSPYFHGNGGTNAH